MAIKAISVSKENVFAVDRSINVACMSTFHRDIGENVYDRVAQTVDRTAHKISLDFLLCESTGQQNSMGYCLFYLIQLEYY